MPVQTATELLKAVRKVRDGYVDQARFADVEQAAYFREFVRRIDAALAAPAQPECQYAVDLGMVEHRCAVKCVYEEKGYARAIEQAAHVAERYDDTETLTAPKAIAAAIRALATASEVEG